MVSEVELVTKYLKCIWYSPNFSVSVTLEIGIEICSGGAVNVSGMLIFLYLQDCSLFLKLISLDIISKDSRTILPGCFGFLIYKMGKTGSTS
jgi:hypothetical protein